MANPLALLVALIRSIVFRFARILSEALLLSGLVDPRRAKSRTASLADFRPANAAQQAALIELCASTRLGLAKDQTLASSA